MKRNNFTVVFLSFLFCGVLFAQNPTDDESAIPSVQAQADNESAIPPLQTQENDEPTIPSVQAQADNESTIPPLQTQENDEPTIPSVQAQADNESTITPLQTQENDEPTIPYALLHNEFYEASLKERSLARLTLEAGDYDVSAAHSAEAERLAGLSDAYIAKKTLLARVNRAILAANELIFWAKSSKAATYYPDELKQAEEHYAISLDSKSNNELETALVNAEAVITDLANVTAPPKKDDPPIDVPSNPNKYTVRPWDVFGDCFWNIAKQFYNDPYKWTVLYEANKDKLPDPKNPNLIPVGTVLDIPSLDKEIRIGMYDTGRPYTR